MRLPYRAAIVVANFLCLSYPALADSFWQADGTVLQLTASGTQRTLTVVRAGPDLAAANVAAGAVLFRGQRIEGTYRGELYDLASGCSTPPVIVVKGQVVNELTVVLTGTRTAAPDCPADRPNGPLRMTVTYLGKTAPDAGIAVPQPDQAASQQDAVVPEETAAPETPQPTQAALAEATTKDVDQPQSEPSATIPDPAAADLPQSVCLGESSSRGLSLAACKGFFHAMRSRHATSGDTEDLRRSLWEAGIGLAPLYARVDAACYSSATLATFDSGIAPAENGDVTADQIMMACLDMEKQVDGLTLTERLAALGPMDIPADSQAARIARTGWTEQGARCTSAQVERFTPLGYFKGATGRETAPANAWVTNWTADQAAASFTLTIEMQSELVPVPDAIVTFTGTLTGESLSVTQSTRVITPATRYGAAPEYTERTKTSVLSACQP